MATSREPPVGEPQGRPHWRAATILGRAYLEACRVGGPAGELLLRSALAGCRRKPGGGGGRSCARLVLAELRRACRELHAPALPVPADAPQRLRPQRLRPLCFGRRAGGTARSRELPRVGRRRRTAPRLLAWLTAVLTTGGLLTARFATWRAADGLGPLDVAQIAVFLPLALWLAQSFWTAVAGARVLLAGPSRPPEALSPSGPRFAILIPVFNEDPARVFAGIEAMWRDLAQTPVFARADLWVLSDTTDPDIWLAELAALERLRARLPGGARLFHRHRATNHRRKTGNLEDFLGRFGSRYGYCLLLDADSLMTGRTIARMVGRMDADPRLGLLQAPPALVRARTTFARFLQFAAAVNGPLTAAGIAWWAGDAGNYWGHNAMFRTAAFRRHCGLPDLPGRPPLGGQILSHDFVEAALLRRAGWKVRIDPDLDGSYEEAPPTLEQFLVRDRRWCQGNLQHLRVLRAPGLHPASRLHLLIGIGSYLASPLWLAFLLLTAAGTVLADGPAATGGAGILATVVALLLAPRLVGAGLALGSSAGRRAFGGGPRLVASALLELLFSALLAPVTMLHHSAWVGGMLLGATVDWQPQRRSVARGAVCDQARRFLWTGLCGAAATTAALLHDPALALRLSPVLAGPLLVLPLACLSARETGGERPAARRLLVTPVETAPPGVVLRTEALLASAVPGEPLRLFSATVRDPAVLDRHLAWLRLGETTALPSPADVERIVRRWQRAGAAGLAVEERRTVLSCPPLLERLHVESWLGRFDAGPTGSRRAVRRDPAAALVAAA